MQKRSAHSRLSIVARIIHKLKRRARIPTHHVAPSTSTSAPSSGPSHPPKPHRATKAKSKSPRKPDSSHSDTSSPIPAGHWTCCLTHRTPLSHHPSSSHPLATLRCTTCTHIFCASCPAPTSTDSAIIRFHFAQGELIPLSLPKKGSQFRTRRIRTRFSREQERKNGKAVRDNAGGVVMYGTVCPGCGLSHRGIGRRVCIDEGAGEKVWGLSFEGVNCDCDGGGGEGGRWEGGGKWVVFRIREWEGRGMAGGKEGMVEEDGKKERKREMKVVSGRLGKAEGETGVAIRVGEMRGSKTIEEEWIDIREDADVSGGKVWSPL